jgi:predicted lipid-binding transport protein (Tim44 family)
MRWLVGTGLVLAAPLAQAYVGPGLGVGIIGMIIGVLASIVLAVLGTVWFPVKRMLRARAGRRADAGGGAADLPEASVEQAREETGQSENR